MDGPDRWREIDSKEVINNRMKGVLLERSELMIHEWVRSEGVGECEDVLVLVISVFANKMFF